MTFIDPQTARAIYEKLMKDSLYSTIGDNKKLKRYVDKLYNHLLYYEIFVGIEILVFMALLFIYIIYPNVELSIIRGGI